MLNNRQKIFAHLLMGWFLLSLAPYFSAYAEHGPKSEHPHSEGARPSAKGSSPSETLGGFTFRNEPEESRLLDQYLDELNLTLHGKGGKTRSGENPPEEKNINQL